jgi:glycerol uptake facilitator protein
MARHSLAGELCAEFLGTMTILTFGCGSVAMIKLFGTGVPGEVVNGGYTNITIAWGLGVTFGIFVAGRLSGGHLNPAVTVPLAIFRGFPWPKVVPYCLAQTAGAFAAAAMVFLNYRAAFAKADPGLEKTMGVFTTFPAFPDTPAAGFIDQVVGTAILLFIVFALTDSRNQSVPGYLQPVLIGLAVVGIGMSFGALHGYAINPARDFGPRVFISLAGFRNNGLTDGTSAYWVPVIGPLLGGLLGAGLYDYGVRRFLPENE